MRTVLRDLGRFVVFAVLAVWLGGLTFYAVIVVPIGTAQLGSTEQGFVTQQVTSQLNLIGVLVLIVLGALTLRHRTHIPLVATWCVLLAVQIGLFIDHAHLSRLMDPSHRTLLVNDFYDQHRVYLWLTAIQWVTGWFWSWHAVRRLPN